ncbi:putative cyclin-dependent kinase 14 isoform X4 [Apostichopus japonicus]|uniref:Putative cyclin-dependent kinase 14 isoform X4 n=1 Tax=Stichopus japonicus TaxID=307972 RepID=A0A2G8JWU8_STIJA|nr:putative cyclin-dependent kinase 14 isoform X4 [Apostichopus japonicus]
MFTLREARDYKKICLLGEGSYAKVYKATNKVNGGVVALKEIRLQTDEGTPFTAIREASLLKDLKHANIVCLHDIIHTKSNLTFVFEFVQTDLSTYLEKNPGGLNPCNVQLFLFQLLRGLAYCHQRKVLHRDLKPQNILISEQGELKLADFGLARAKSVPSQTYSNEVVTLWYRPPDGCGLHLLEMLWGHPVFPGVKNHKDQLQKIFMLLGTPTEKDWPGVSNLSEYKEIVTRTQRSRPLSDVIPKVSEVPEAGNFASQLLQMNPRKRISAEAAMRHDYFSNLPEPIHHLSEGRCNLSNMTVLNDEIGEELPLCSFCQRLNSNRSINGSSERWPSFSRPRRGYLNPPLKSSVLQTE